MLEAYFQLNIAQCLAVLHIQDLHPEELAESAVNWSDFQLAFAFPTLYNFASKFYFRSAKTRLSCHLSLMYLLVTFTVNH